MSVSLLLDVCLYFERRYVMKEKTLENFKKLSPEKQDELIAFLIKLKSYYGPIFAHLHLTENKD